jgi:hypothetical protein
VRPYQATAQGGPPHRENGFHAGDPKTDNDGEELGRTDGSQGGKCLAHAKNGRFHLALRVAAHKHADQGPKRGGGTKNEGKFHYIIENNGEKMSVFSVSMILLKINGL